MDLVKSIKERFERMQGLLNERARRLFAARESLATGWGGVATVALVGDFKNGGQELRPKGDPEKVRGHDFVDPEPGCASPCGVYDLANNQAWGRRSLRDRSSPSAR